MSFESVLNLMVDFHKLQNFRSMIKLVNSVVSPLIDYVTIGIDDKPETKLQQLSNK